jgi:hypothetical protein
MDLETLKRIPLLAGATALSVVLGLGHALAADYEYSLPKSDWKPAPAPNVLPTAPDVRPPGSDTSARREGSDKPRCRPIPPCPKGQTCGQECILY